MTAARSRHITVGLAVALAAFCAFINLYAPQAVLPLLANEFHASAAEIANVLTASTIAVALVAPFVGTVADVLGRKRVILAAMFMLAVPMVMAAMAPTLAALTFWRFVQGMALPAVFAVAIAYMGEELTAKEATSAAGLYTMGASLGGFGGRFITGIVTDYSSWRTAFFVLAAMSFTGTFLIALWLPREKKFVRSEGLLASSRQMLRHLRNPQLLATYAVGFGVLFNFLVTFTYISFHLSLPPYQLSASGLGSIFITYLAAAALTPLVGWAIGRFGRRQFTIGVLAAWMIGVALTLAQPLWIIIVGLTFCTCCGLICQAISTGYVTITAQVGRSSAVGLYATSFYVGGSCGAALGGLAWTLGRYPACVALVLAMLAVMAIIVATAWTAKPTVTKPAPIEPP